MKTHTNRHKEAKLLPPDTFLSPKMRLRPGLRPRLRWGSLQRSRRPPSWLWGRGPRKGEGREGERRGREGRGGIGRGGEGWEGEGLSPERESWLRPCVQFVTKKLSVTLTTDSDIKNVDNANDYGDDDDGDNDYDDDDNQ